MCCQFNVPSNTSSLWTTRQDVRPKPRSATNLNRLHKQKSDYVVVYILNAMRVASDDTCDYGQQISKPMAWLGISQTRMSWLLPRLGTCANRRNLQNHSHANDANDLHMYIHTYIFVSRLLQRYVLTPRAPRVHRPLIIFLWTLAPYQAT